MTPPEVFAAGGVILRPTGDGHEVLVVHRPGHRDWSLPKGKLDDDETFLAAASREVEEETGVVPLVGRELTSVRYRDSQNRSKLVRYWRMSVHREVDWEPDAEVGETAWWSTGRAIAELTYGHDRDLVVQALFTPSTIRLALVRHAHAGKRADWTGDDDLRPLSKKGRRQSKQLVQVFRRRRITSLTTSPLRRCVQTLTPLASATRRDLTTDQRLAEGASLTDLTNLLAGLGDGGVCCSHGSEIGMLLDHLASSNNAFPKQIRKQKGSTWWLVLDDDGFVRQARYQAATS